LLATGCAAVLNEVVTDDVLRDAVRALIERRQKTIAARKLASRSVDDLPALTDFVSSNPRMESFLRVVRRVVEPNSSLLVLGETGVGKERLARAIHAESPRADAPFVPVILSAFPESLLEGELFGYEKGAFTGADKTRRGYFELAHGGTVFLDEIGEMAPHLQVKLLGVLQDRSIRRLGSERTIPIDVRVMAATNRDLRDAVKDGSFRSDLFYRLSVVTLDIPPLRKHPEDVAGLVQRYLEEFRVRLGRNVTEIGDDAMVALRDYSWPGNIRELINVVERAVLLCEGSTITLRDLPFELVHSASDVPGDSLIGIDLQLSEEWLERPWKPVRSATMAQAELTYLHEHLVEARGDLSEVADRSGLNPRTLFDMMQRHGLKKESFKSSRRPRD